VLRFASRARHLALVTLLLALPVQAAAEPGLSLMHGFADMASITLWAQTDRAARLTVEFAPETEPSRARRIEQATRADEDFVAHLRLANLDPGTAYRYSVRVDGAKAREGRFRTQPFWQFRSDPPEVSIALGSCAYINDRFDRANDRWVPGYGVFDAIAARAPDFMLWLGDNIYLRAPEWTSREGMSARYRQYRELPEISRLWTATSHLAIWDDHDYGPNDSDGSFVGKGNALATFKRYWPNPTFGLPGTEGVFGAVAIGDVDLFLLDNRFHRYPNRYPQVAQKTMFGAAQLEWLKQALLASRATFKVVAAGGQFWNQANRFEGLHDYPADRQALYDWLVEQRIGGVVFVSGDRHFSQLLRVPRPGTYPLYELTASPLAAGVFDNLPNVERENPDLVPGTLVLQRNFGMLRATGPRSARVLAFESYDAEGRLLWRREVNAAELRGEVR
jgi:alkaline phosphatase D